VAPSCIVHGGAAFCCSSLNPNENEEKTMATLGSEFPETSFSSDNGATRAADVKEHLTSRIGSRVQSMLENASEKFSGAKSSVSSAASKARVQAGDKIETVGGIMHKHPLATIAIGLGAGYLLGRLMARR
jgi:ElaB/YqjD/DUF883 family membrane-anchored ribosome-binding protein